MTFDAINLGTRKLGRKVGRNGLGLVSKKTLP